MRKMLAAAAVVAFGLTGCRTQDVLTSAASFKADADRFAQLSSQVVADFRGSCVRKLRVESTKPASIATSVPLHEDDASVKAACAGPFRTADELSGTFQKLSAYFAQLTAAATGKTPDFDVGAATKALTSAQLIDAAGKNAIDGASGTLADYVVGHARVVAVQAAVRSADDALQQVDDRVQRVFGTSGCTQRTYCGFLDDESDSVRRVAADYRRLVPPAGATLADQFALLQVIRERDAYLDRQQARVDTGKQLAAAYHALAVKHAALRRLMDRVPSSGEAVLDRL